MPTYEYECPDCGIIEIIHGMNDDPPKICPNCKTTITRLYGNFIFPKYSPSAVKQVDKGMDSGSDIETVIGDQPVRFKVKEHYK